jgi:hypothetical protein
MSSLPPQRWGANPNRSIALAPLPCNVKIAGCGPVLFGTYVVWIRFKVSSPWFNGSKVQRFNDFGSETRIYSVSWKIDSLLEKFLKPTGMKIVLPILVIGVRISSETLNR